VTDVPRDDAPGAGGGGLSSEGEQPLRKGLPDDWAQVSAAGPTWLDLPAGWADLLLRYAGMGPSASLDQILLKTVGQQGPSRALLEGDYIDADYRDEFAHFYAQTYRPLPDRCERLHFFDDAPERTRYLGYTVLRPVVGRPVCRTMLAPPPEIAPDVSCLARSSATPYGYPLSIKAFPFMSQDYQYGTCSHAAIWMIALYFHLQFRRPRYFLSDLAGSASTHQDLLPALPSGGLTPRQIIAILHDLKMPPVVYRVDRKLPPRETVETIACRYLNSRLPVILLSEGNDEGHARVLIGYGRSENGLHFVHHDDQKGPYLTAPSPLSTPPGDAASADQADATGSARTDRSDWQALVVPLPGRIYLSGEAAEYTARLIFEEKSSESESLRDYAERLETGELRLRSHVIQVAEYRRALRRRGVPRDVFTWHVNMSSSHWLWVVELQDRALAAKGRRCVLGEVAIDATSDDQWPNPLFANLPGLLVRWPRLGDETDEATSSQTEPYLTGCALHTA
jgi:hypothetical protein